MERWTEIKPILAELIVLDSTEQTKHLGRIDDPALRHAVAGLLDFDESKSAILAQPLANWAPGANY